MNVSLFTLKPVAFSNGNSKVKGYAFYLQCDVTANEGNGLGFSAGEWVPNLKIEFELIGEDGKVAANGELMPMNALDGPCYGSNVKLKDAGDYAVHLVVRNPETSGHFIITDEKVGPEKTFADWFGAGNLEIRYEGWTYAPTK